MLIILLKIIIVIYVVMFISPMIDGTLLIIQMIILLHLLTNFTKSVQHGIEGDSFHQKLKQQRKDLIRFYLSIHESTL